MSHLLLIETATRVCSVGVTSGSEIISLREDASADYSHSRVLMPFIKEVMIESGLDFFQLDAVAVSMGPGSYTGLRIGISAAKGFCFALDKPLIAISTLQSMTVIAKQTSKNKYNYYIPMIDARRMEVYNAVYDQSGTLNRPVQAEIIDQDSFNAFLEEGTVTFFGDGAPKCKEIIQHSNAIFFDDVFPRVSGMSELALKKFTKNEFEDTAYFEPYYLKDFIAGKPKVKGLM